MSKPNSAAVALAKRRWAGVSASERHDAMSAVSAARTKSSRISGAKKAWEKRRKLYGSSGLKK